MSERIACSRDCTVFQLRSITFIVLYGGKGLLNEGRGLLWLTWSNEQDAEPFLHSTMKWWITNNNGQNRCPHAIPGVLCSYPSHCLLTGIKHAESYTASEAVSTEPSYKHRLFGQGRECVWLNVQEAEAPPGIATELQCWGFIRAAGEEEVTERRWTGRTWFLNDDLSPHFIFFFHISRLQFSNGSYSLWLTTSFPATEILVL